MFHIYTCSCNELRALGLEGGRLRGGLMALCTSSEEETRKVLSFSSQDPDSRHGRDSVLHREVYTAHQGAFLMESLEQASWRGSHTPGLAVLEAFEQCPQQRAVIPAAPSCSGSWTKCCRYLITEILHSIPFHAIPFRSIPSGAGRAALRRHLLADPAHLRRSRKLRSTS